MEKGWRTSRNLTPCLTALFKSKLWFQSRAQNRDFAQSVIDTLSSDYYSGRGYINQGDLLSARYIAEQFKSLGLKPLEQGYFQTFQLQVNTIPKCDLVIDGVKLINIGGNKFRKVMALSRLK